MRMNQIPDPAIERLLHLLRFLERLDVQFITSSEIEEYTGWSSATVRKDISYLEGISAGTAGYEVGRLKEVIRETLGLTEGRRICIVGLGRLGSAFLNFTGFEQEGFHLVAGFDSSVNRVEILRSPVPLYPTYKMAEVISRFQIELALLCVPASEAQKSAEKLVAAGIRGILNFAPVVLTVPPTVAVENLYVVDGLRALTARLTSKKVTEPGIPGKNE